MRPWAPGARLWHDHERGMSGSAPVASNSFPRPLLFAVGGMLVALIGLAGVARLQGTSTDIPASTAVAERSLLFDDMADGSVSVRDAANGRMVTVVTGEAGFLRATLRGLAQQRRRENLDEAPPFDLTRWADGRLTLDDPVTRRHIELEAFGGTNEAVFAALLTAKEDP